MATLRGALKHAFNAFVYRPEPTKTDSGLHTTGGGYGGSYGGGRPDRSQRHFGFYVTLIS